MRHLLLLFIAGSYLNVSGQVVVRNPTPNISLELNQKILYRGLWNPVIISTGKATIAKVSIDNGQIKKTDIPGKYLILPGRDTTGAYNPYTTVRITADGREYEFEFYLVWTGPPLIEIAPQSNDHNAVGYFKFSYGVAAWYRNPGFDAYFTVDSFTITFSDSVSSHTHRNIGALWDNISKGRLDRLKAGMIITIKDVYATGPDRKYFFSEERKYHVGRNL